MIFGFGNQKQPVTFKERVAAFWEWYPQHADRFFATIDAGEAASLADEVGEYMADTLPGLAWVFGPGEGTGHSLTVSGEGILVKQLLAEYWLRCAVPIPGWTFYASRQPARADELAGMAIGIGVNESVDADNLLFDTQIDDESQKIDVKVWHPLFARLPEDHHWQIVFLLLDEALGEFGTQMWLGNIEIEPFEASKTTRPLAALPAFIEQVNKYHQWQKLPPLETYSVYEVNEQSDVRRGDTLVGTSCIPRIVGEMLENNGSLPEDPLEGTGAEIVYLSIDASVFPAGQQSDIRGSIEDAISTSLQTEQSGRTLGGAFGIRQSYIDLILFDGERSRELISKTLHGLQLAGKSKLHSFV